MAFIVRQWPLRKSRLIASGRYLRFQEHYDQHTCFCLRYHTHKATDPLRILFCGSDELSVKSLRALHREHVEHPERIASIDVVSRPGKRVGRGLKVIRQLPITTAAKELALSVHLIDTFTGWQPPKLDGNTIDLVVAVSFGLLVPPRILNSCKHGGINVHPSLLPDFRGPAPLQHILIHGRKKSGVTVQTLHPHRFDRGQIIAQTPHPGFELPNGSNCTYEELRDFISPICADTLLKTIRQRLFALPVKDAGRLNQLESNQDLVHASKISSDMRIIKWEEWDADTIIRYNNALGNMWDYITYQRCTGNLQAQKRVNFHKLELVEDPPIIGSKTPDKPGLPVLSTVNSRPDLLLSTKELSRFIRPVRCTVEGKSSDTGHQTLLALHMKNVKGSTKVNNDKND